MNAHQALKQSVGRTLLAQVFNNEQLVNLHTVSSTADASSKLQGDTRPTFDSNLKAVSNDGLFTKSTQAVFPRLQAEQIARSHAHLAGLLDAKDEFDTSITFDNTYDLDGVQVSLPRTVSFHELVEIPSLIFLIDVIFNDGTELNLSTYDRDLTINDGFYGNPSSDTTTYLATPHVISLDSTGNSINDGIRDGIPGDGLVLSATTPGLLNLIHTGKHINGKIKLRAVGVKDGNLLFGAVRLANLTIDQAQHSVNDGASVVTLSTIKNWDQIKNQYGSQTADAVHLSFFPNDGFFKHASSVAYTKLWKENNDQ